MRKKSILAIESIYNDFWLNCNRNFGVNQAPNSENMANSSAANLDTASLRQFLLDALVRLAYREGDFTLSSGQRSYYYTTVNKLPSLLRGALAVGRLLLSLLPPDTQAVAGLTLGADPIVRQPLLWYLPTKIARFQL
jgi:orotate phosphoribosyltransferase